MITLVTTVWEKDFDQVLDHNSWFLNYRSDFVTRKILNVNNINKESRGRLLEKIKSAQETFAFDVVFVDENAEKAKHYFKLAIDEQTLGYRYTIQYFVMILKCETPFLLNVSADCDMHFEEEYLKDSVDILTRDPKAIATTLPCVIPWRKDNTNAGPHEEQALRKKYKENLPSLEHFNYSAGFSDQTFLGDMAKLRAIDYNDIHPDATQFPAYGGDCFEKRVCSHLLRHHHYRLIYNKYHYVHYVPEPKRENFIKKIKRKFFHSF